MIESRLRKQCWQVLRRQLGATHLHRGRGERCHIVERYGFEVPVAARRALPAALRFRGIDDGQLTRVPTESGKVTAASVLARMSSPNRARLPRALNAAQRGAS